MGFLKYIGKELKHAIGEWWYNDGLASLAAFALVFGMALVISAIVFAPEHIQKNYHYYFISTYGDYFVSSYCIGDMANN